VTSDQGLRYQQNGSGLNLGIVVIIAHDNRVETFPALGDHVRSAAETVAAGQVIEVRE